MKNRTRVRLKGRDMPGIVCAVQTNYHDRSEPTRYWVLWRDCSKTCHAGEQLEAMD